MPEAKKLEGQFIGELERLLARQIAAKTLGVEIDSSNGSVKPRSPTLKEWLRGRFADSRRALHTAHTARTVESNVRVLIFYLGGELIDEIDAAVVNRYVEARLKDPPLTFSFRKDGSPKRARVETVGHSTVNRSLEVLRAALRLAEAENVIVKAPSINLLPRDSSSPVLPPTDEDYERLIVGAKAVLEVAPLMEKVVGLFAETGLREGELFHLTWRSVDFKLGETGAVRVEKQRKARAVNGVVWRPKDRDWRFVPLTRLARELLVELRERQPKQDLDDLVIPNQNGCPYVRMSGAPRGSGSGRWDDMCRAAGVHVHPHQLRHLFAVRALLRGVPLRVVSQWLGHSDVNLTAQQYGRWANEAKEQWTWARLLDRSVEDVAEDSRRPVLGLVPGGRTGSSEPA
jgi:integrase